MLRITANLKTYMVQNHALAEDADEATTRKAVSDAIADGKLELSKLAELTKAEESDAEKKVRSLVRDEMSGLNGKLDKLFDMIGTKSGDGAQTKAAAADASATAGVAQKAFAAAAAAQGDPAASADDARIRVKSVVEQFDDSRTAATWDKSGNIRNAKHLGGRSITENWENYGAIDMPTRRSKALAGAWFKHMVNRAARGKGVQPVFKMTELDRQLVEYAVHECSFYGPVGEDGYEYEGTKLFTDLHRKTLLDDSTSGGLEAVPIEFDAAFILTPLLTGELFPLVTVTQVTRRRIEATKIGNPTLGWGTAEGTAIGLFDTDSLVSAFDNTIYPVSGAMEIGRDMLADSPLDIGGIVVQRYGQAFLKEMDTVIAEGNGTNQPTGIMTTSGYTSVTPSGGAGAAQTVGDYEALYFNIAKEYRTEPGARFIYLSTDTSYKRARGIPVDSSNDQRRVFGMDQTDYMLFGHPYRVCSSLDNAQIAGVCINRFRLYRRAGLEVRIVTEDASLARANTQLIVVRARFGGAMEQAGAMVAITTGQA